MSFQISSLVVAVGIVVLASLLAPEGKTKKWVNFVLGLAAFSALATPLLSLEEWTVDLPDNLPTALQTEGDATAYMFKMTEEELTRQIKTVFGITSTRFYVDLSEYEEKTAVLCYADQEKAEGICAYLRALLPEDWEVKVDGR